MTSIAPFELAYETRGFDCGYGGPLKPLPLMNILQEAAGAHADRLGWGIEDLMADGKTWMLSRMELRIDRLPRTGEQLVIETWPAGLDRLFALRDFALRSAAGQLLVRAVYAYLIVDRVSHRPLRPERILGSAITEGAKPHPVAEPSFAVPQVPTSPAAVELRASPRHLDNNGHVNNAHIVDWLVDAVPRALRAERELRSLRVEFLAETLDGDEIRSFSGSSGGGESRPSIVTELRRGEEPIARALSSWE
ncbi:MAG TPA: acyl-ACP thioesterase domain-containing protein [Rectinemataceae bacterium]|nr:acyl-ACP thioesterase domain-containing protein [Rectinemataceae bacterium]